MNSRHRFLACLSVLLSVFSQTAVAVSLVPISEVEGLSPLAPKSGYLLIELATTGTAPSLEFSRYLLRGQSYLSDNQQARLNRKEFKFNLAGLKPGFYLAKAQAGLYQIKRVNSPHFDLPFRLDTEADRDWRFHITAGKTNYIGRLVIKKERSTDSVDIKLKNRLATSKITLETELEPLLNQFPLESGVGVRDDFWLELNNAQ